MAGRTAIVTGASRGIGRAVATRLVAEGAQVVITGRTADTLAEAVTHLGGSDHALAVPGNAADDEHQDAVIEAALGAYGRIDFLVNNTGINPKYGPLLEVDRGVARKTVETNCIAALSWVQKVHHAWMGDHGGAIVNVASVAGLRPATGIGFYGATKAMLSHLTSQLAVELAPGVRVNAVAPAAVRTSFASALIDGREDQLVADYPLARLGVPDDVAGAVIYLLSDDSSWVTGQTLVVDGGLMQTGGV